MKKMSFKKNIALLILLIFLLLGFVYEVKNDRDMEGVPATATSTLTHEKVTKNTDAVTVNIEYPAIPGETEDIVDANTFLKSEWDARITSFEKDAEDSLAANIQLPEDVKSTAQGAPVIEEQNGRYIALFMSAEWYLRGAAHPMHTISTYVYDYDKKTFADVGSFFLPESNYLDVLSTLSKEDLVRQANEGDVGYEYNKEFVDEGTKPTKENFSHVLPLKDGLVIYFEEYQVAPYAAGPQEVVIPYSKLKNIINPDGVLGIYVK